MYRRQLVETALWAGILQETHDLPTYEQALDEVRQHAVVGPCVEMQVGTDRASTFLTAERIVHAAVAALLSINGAPPQPDEAVWWWGLVGAGSGGLGQILGDRPTAVAGHVGRS